MHWCQQENDLVMQGLMTLAVMWENIAGKAAWLYRYLDNGCWLLEQEIKKIGRVK